MKLSEIEDAFSNHIKSEYTLYTGSTGYVLWNEYLEIARQQYLRERYNHYDKFLEEFHWTTSIMWNYKNIKIV